MIPPDPDVVVAACNGPWRVGLLATRLARADGRRLVTSTDHAIAELLVTSFPDGADGPQLRRFLAAPETIAFHASLDPDEAPAEHTPGPLAHLDGLPALVAVLDVPALELEHLARWHRPDADSGPRRAQHYHYTLRPTRGGGTRVLEAPKERLKEVQRRALRRILTRAPLHDAAFGSTHGRGVVDAIAQHTAADVVVTLDLERFFTTVTAIRVGGWFARQGAAPDVAALLARLTTNAVPLAVRRTLPPLPGATGPDRTWQRDRELGTRHLPQGSPTSPALADRICRTLDARLAALARRRDLTYTRYVDDLTFSGASHTDTAHLVRTVETIVRDEGFRPADDKTRVQRSSGRQRVLGAVVNAHPTLSRAERDALEATVHNCRLHGWRTQLRDRPAEGFRERLTGRVAWLAALDPARGRRLLTELDAVDWS